MSWLPGLTETSGGALTLRPEAAARAHELELALHSDNGLESSLVELVRDRVGVVLCVPGATFDTRAERSDRERAALAFVEQYVIDPSGVTDEQAAGLHELFTEPELTALTFTVAVYDALARIRLVLDDTGAPS